MRTQLQRAVRALMQPADIQLSYFPDFVCKADELALDFEDGLYERVGHEDEYPAEQRAAIDALGASLRAMGGGHNAVFWTDEAVRSHSRWEEVRRLAEAIVRACGWSPEPPGPSGAVYIPGG